MDKVCGYRVCTAPNLDQLERAVRRLIEQGWEPIGGIAVTVLGARIAYLSEYPPMQVAQAMIMRSVPVVEETDRGR